ncbi:MAG: 50S ribosomal protein L21 [Planctomycetes bacterium]|nr:50S ribosomal protein L21 [Planctomycetota bacterium]
MYAIFEDSGTQIKVNVGDIVDLDSRVVEEGTKALTFDKVLAVGAGDGNAAKIGMPYLSGATVTAEVMGEAKGEKLRTGKYKRRKGYRRQAGHRQEYLRVKITAIKAA